MDPPVGRPRGAAPRPRSTATPWAERIVMVADDADFDEWQREWLAKNGLTADQPAAAADG